MSKTIVRRERLSIDVTPKEHKKIKILAVLHGETIREFVLESVQERISQENEEKGLKYLTGNINKDPVLEKLWNNKKDAAYDKL